MNKVCAIKYIVCLVIGHRLDTPSIIDFMDSKNYLKRCSRCGLYHAHSSMSGISLTVSERWAMKQKREFDEEFHKSENGGLTMAENYKHLYEQTKKMVEYYQDVIVPGLRKVIGDLKKRQSEIGNCDGCYWKEIDRYHKCSCCRRNRDMKDCYRRSDK